MTKITRLKLMSTAHANTIAKPSPCCDAQDAWSNEGAMHVPLQEDRAHARTSAAAPSRQAEVGQVIVLAPVERLPISPDLANVAMNGTTSDPLDGFIATSAHDTENRA